MCRSRQRFRQAGPMVGGCAFEPSQGEGEVLGATASTRAQPARETRSNTNSARLWMTGAPTPILRGEIEERIIQIVIVIGIGIVKVIIAVGGVEAVTGAGDGRRRGRCGIAASGNGGTSKFMSLTQAAGTQIATMIASKRADPWTP